MAFANAFNIGSTIGSAFSPLVNSAIGSIFANNASGKAFGRQLYAMQRQAELNYHYGLKSLENSPTSQRKGLESAGYNPMLAVQNATSGANSGWTSPNSVNMDEYSGNIMAQASNAQGFMNARAMQEQTASNIALNQTQENVNKAQAEKTRSENVSQNIHNKYLDTKEQKEIGKLDAETSKLSADTAYTNELKDNIKAQLEMQKYTADVMAMSGITQAGIHSNASRYSADKSYQATKYSSDKAFQGGLTGTALTLGAGGLAWLASRGLIKRNPVGFRTK